MKEHDERDQVTQRRRWKAEYEDQHSKPALQFIGLILEAVAILTAFSASGMFTARGDTPRATAAIAIAIAGFALIVAGRREM